MDTQTLEIKPIAWSYSALDQFLTCPKQYAEIRVFKNFKDLNTEHRDWGNHVHQCIELSLRDGIPLPPDMDQWQIVVDRFRSLKGELHTEQKIALTRSFRQCDYFDPDVWVRVILDAMWINGKVAKVVDWKTGKRRLGSPQLKLFAAVVFALYPDVDEVRTMFVWLKEVTPEGTIMQDTEVYRREDVGSLWGRFLPDVKRLEYAHKTQTWIPKTSGLCNAHCPITTCSFNGKRRQ